MLESKKELAVLETNLSSASTKRSPFHLLSSIFSKKKASILDNEVLDKPSKTQVQHQSSEPTIKAQQQQDVQGEESTPPQCSTVPGSLTDCRSNIIEEFRSPATSVKRKNLKVDLETLHLSRQDNPYLKQLERFSLPEETLISCADFQSLAEKALLQSEWLLDSDKDVDIHQHLVRSPPPQFPQNITHFMYSQANSPKRQINHTTDNSQENLESPVKQCKKAKSLNPIQPKKEMGVLDPGIREVLEYQKSQLIAGIQHSLSIGQAKFGTAPARYVPAQTTLHHNNTFSNSQARWTNESGSRLSTTSQSQVPNATTSLPGLTSCYLDLMAIGDQTSRKTPLGPIRIGRTLSDSICQDNKHWNTGIKQ